MEKWANVNRFEGIYMVSNLGNVKSLARIIDYGKIKALRPERILKHSVDSGGYKYCILSKGKVKKTIKIHRIVAEAFIPNPLNKPCVNHMDGKKQNNNLNNLEWCTHKENVVHAYKNNLNSGIKGEKSHLSKLKLADIKKIRSIYNKGGISQLNLGILFNISQTQVSRIVNNTNWTS
jgi:hypothetical protein